MFHGSQFKKSTLNVNASTSSLDNSSVIIEKKSSQPYTEQSIKDIFIF